MPQLYRTVSAPSLLAVDIASRWRYVSVGSFDDCNTIAQPFGDDVNRFAFAD